MIFLDTSVLVAIAQVGHTHHKTSRELWNYLDGKPTAVCVHTIAESYATFTGMPPAFRLAPRDAVSVIEIFLKRLTPVMLAPEDYLTAVHNAAELGFTSGMIYDSLQLASARKVNAERIYTWNLRHFQALAPDLRDRITTPTAITA